MDRFTEVASFALDATVSIVRSLVALVCVYSLP